MFDLRMVRTPLFRIAPLVLGLAVVASGLADRDGARPVGYAERVRVGALGPLRFDDRLVIEIEGITSPYLRGRTLSRYHDGAWWPKESALLPVAAQGEATHRARLADGAAFLPLGAQVVASPAGAARRRADGTHVLAPEATWVGFRLEAEDAAPDPDDLEVPPAMREALVKRARALAGRGTPREQAERLRRALATSMDYRLDFEPRPGVDPVLDFLERGEGGHCELFASAYVLLARSLGIPARLVSGYYASERVPEAGILRARRSDAHAWAEVYVDGRYRTADPTPPQGSKTTSMRFRFPSTSLPTPDTPRSSSASAISSS